MHDVRIYASLNIFKELKGRFCFYGRRLWCYDKHNDYCTEKEEPEMKSLSIYSITRKQNTEQLQKLERQLSGKGIFSESA